LGRFTPRGHRQQVQVVVAQQAGGAALQVAQAAQHAQGIGAAVDQVAQQVEMIAGRGKVQFGQQPFEGVAAALEVADEVVHHTILLRSCPIAFSSAAWNLLRRLPWTLRYLPS
jgi:hypothetical protein